MTVDECGPRGQAQSVLPELQGRDGLAGEAGQLGALQSGSGACAVDRVLPGYSCPSCLTVSRSQ